MLQNLSSAAVVISALRVMNVMCQLYRYIPVDDIACELGSSKVVFYALSGCINTYMYEGHPIKNETFFIV